MMSTNQALEYWHTRANTFEQENQTIIFKNAELQAENKRLKEVLFDYMRTMRKIAGNIWDTKTAVSIHAMLGEMEKDVEQALNGEQWLK